MAIKIKSRKIITHLCPDKVLELENIGIEFPCTACSWLKDMMGNDWELESTDTAQWYHANPDSVYNLILPAPDLSELLDVMPEAIRLFEGGCKFKLSLTKIKNLWICDYVSPIGTFAGSSFDRKFYDSPLEAVVSRLKYLINNNLLEEYESKN